MKHRWQLQRSYLARADGQRRWDQAYQASCNGLEKRIHRRKIMAVALYARVSTHRQQQAQTIEQQIERLQSHATAQGWEITAEHLFRGDAGHRASAISLRRRDDADTPRGWCSHRRPCRH
jgi:predicted site-specific integrase-resolvase